MKGVNNMSFARAAVGSNGLLGATCGKRYHACKSSRLQRHICSPGRKNKLVRPMNITFAVYWGKFPSFSSSLFSILFIVGCFVCYL